MAGLSNTNEGYTQPCHNPDCTRQAVKRSSEGPPRLYCSNACRTAAWRKRQTQQPTPPPAPTAVVPHPKPTQQPPQDQALKDPTGQRLSQALAALNDVALQAAEPHMTDSATEALRRARQALSDDNSP